MTRIPSSSSTDPLASLRRLMPRDRVLLGLLAEHYVLSTEQVATALFPSLRSAQERLTVLYRLGAVSRFALPRSDGLPTSYRYTLGPLGAQLYPTDYTDPDDLSARAPRTHVERRMRIARSPRLGHLLGVNGFFTALLGHARGHPGTGLDRWWSEQHATAAYAASGRTLARPDGHGVWRSGTASVGFFLEHDTGTEDVARVVGKLPGYERLAHDTGVAYPVLLWVPDARRAGRLLGTLAGVPTLMPVAVATHAPDPAGPVWALPDRPGRRLCLHELPAGRNQAPRDPGRTADPLGPRPAQTPSTDPAPPSRGHGNGGAGRRYPSAACQTGPV